MANASLLLAEESTLAAEILVPVVSTVGAVSVALLSYLAARSTKSRDAKKNIQTGDYRLKNLDLAVQVAWKPVSEEEWQRKLGRMKRGRIAVGILCIVAFALAQVSAMTGSPSTFLSFVPTILLFAVALVAEFCWFWLTWAIKMSKDKSAAEAASYGLDLLVQGSQEDILSRCVAAVRKIGHAIASVDVQPSAARLISVGDYGQELLHVDLSLESENEFRVRIRATRRAAYSSSRKTRRCVLSLVEQLTGYPLYTSPPATANGTPLQLVVARGEPVAVAVEEPVSITAAGGDPPPST